MHMCTGYSPLLHLHFQSPTLPALLLSWETDPCGLHLPVSLVTWLLAGFSQWQVPAKDWWGKERKIRVTLPPHTHPSSDTVTLGRKT